jgi:hypothetical protein
VKILFVMASAEYLRYYDDTIRLLASRGHDVVLALNQDSGKKLVTLDGLTGVTEARVSVLGVLPVAAPFWDRLTRGLRGTIDFVRYLDPRLADAHALRTRIKRKVLPRPLHALDRIRTLNAWTTRALIRTLAVFERAVPTMREMDALLASIAPDLIVVTPLVDAASRQVDVVKSGQRRGIPVAAGIASWDNLTNKGLLRLAPDAVLVWNDTQKHEAVTLHGISPDRVVVTGAQLFDRWFTSAPSRGVDEFCRMVGFSAATPYALFTCSSGFISEGRAEVAFVRTWIETLRASTDPTVAGLPVLVRPHPYNARAWVDADLSGLPNVVIWPRGPYNPVSDESRAAFFDSLYYSAAVVGINTSAMIEAAIVGRPVLSIRTAQFASTQEGTLHFHYLLPENGGFLRVAASLDEHVTQLAAVLEQPDVVRRELDGFVERFIRPGGRAMPATPVVVDTLESLAARRVPRRRNLAATPLRPLVWLIAAVSGAVAAGSGDRVARARKATRLRLHRTRKRIGTLVQFPR